MVTRTLTAGHAAFMERMMLWAAFPPDSEPPGDRYGSSPPRAGSGRSTSRTASPEEFESAGYRVTHRETLHDSWWAPACAIHATA
jgi:hypothetical protein